MSSASRPLLSIRGLKVRYPAERPWWGPIKEWVQAVDGVDLDLPQGQTVALVGESGCGKSSLARGIVRLVDPWAGELNFAPDESQQKRVPGLSRLMQERGRDGVLDLARLPARQLKPARGAVAMVFQDPYSSLNPRMRIGESVVEPLIIQRLLNGRALDERAGELLERVGLSADYRRRYPHELSGGQRQRVGIARALALEPALVICDEAVSALDVSVQAQILQLLQRLQAEDGLTVLFITHDLAVVRQIADQVAVMYLGRVVEQGPSEAVFEEPSHPYTQTLLRAVPRPIPGQRSSSAPVGEPPSPRKPPPGCRFHPRCTEALERCREEIPGEFVPTPGRRVACFLHEPSPAQQQVSSAPSPSQS